jgi:hypothetical protein
MTDDHRTQDAETAVPVGTRVSVKPANGGKTGFVVEDFGPLPANATVKLNQSTTIRPRRYAIALDNGDLIFLDAEEFDSDT